MKLHSLGSSLEWFVASSPTAPGSVARSFRNFYQFPSLLDLFFLLLSSICDKSTKNTFHL